MSARLLSPSPSPQLALPSTGVHLGDVLIELSSPGTPSTTANLPNLISCPFPDFPPGEIVAFLIARPAYDAASSAKRSWCALC